MDNEEKFHIGEHVLVHVKGYRPWPAKITSIGVPEKKYGVYFYGTKELSVCKCEEMEPYLENEEKLKRNSSGKYYNEGINELNKELAENDELGNQMINEKRNLNSGDRVTTRKQASGVQMASTSTDNRSKENAKSSRDDTDEQIEEVDTDGEYSKEDSEDGYSGGDISLEEDLAEECSPEEDESKDEKQLHQDEIYTRSGRKVKQRKLYDN